MAILQCILLLNSITFRMPCGNMANRAHVVFFGGGFDGEW